MSAHPSPADEFREEITRMFCPPAAKPKACKCCGMDMTGSLFDDYCRPCNREIRGPFGERDDE